jgi:hypothetical protein
MSELEALIAETEELRFANRVAGRQIEALACAIRLKALKDAKRAIDRESALMGKP